MSNSNYWANLAVNKSREKAYGDSDNRIFYLNDGAEFQIELFNPKPFVMGVTLAFDGKDESKNLLVLKPGERVWLDRYLHTPKKLKFSTYNVEDSEECKEAISNNGNIVIRFYKEKEEYRNDFWLTNRNNWQSPFEKKDYWKTTTITCYNYPETSFKSLINNLQAPASPAIKTSCCYNANIETGRIEEGQHSEQAFSNIDKEFDIIPYNTEYIKILPVSQKPLTSSDLTKKYCYNCGRKIKDKFKFCPFCGIKQD